MTSSLSSQFQSQDGCDFTDSGNCNNKAEVPLILQRQIAVGIIRNNQKNIFITQRAADSHMAGFWEFPGGKIETGETAEDALIRELYEEVGIQVKSATQVNVLTHHFVDREITLHFFLVEDWEGEPYGREGQPVRWVQQQALHVKDFPPANHEIIQLLLNE